MLQNTTILDLLARKNRKFRFLVFLVPSPHPRLKVVSIMTVESWERERERETEEHLVSEKKSNETILIFDRWWDGFLILFLFQLVIGSSFEDVLVQITHSDPADTFVASLAHFPPLWSSSCSPPVLTSRICSGSSSFEWQSDRMDPSWDQVSLSLSVLTFHQGRQQHVCHPWFCYDFFET